MSTKRFFLAFALAAFSFGSTMRAADNWTSIFSTAALPEWNFFECTGGGTETFSNLGSSSSSYATRTWTGNNGVEWSATDARTDLDLTGDAIALRTSTLKNTTAVAGGIGTLSFNYQRVFTGNSTLKVFVNGVQYGGDITVSATTTTVYSQPINVAGSVNIEIRNSGNRTVIDDISWNCFGTPVVGPELQLADALGVNQDCGNLFVNFGSQSVDVSSDAVFTIKNTGTSNLTISSIALSNTTDFTIISPSTLPLTVSASGSAIVLVRFDAATSGDKSSTLTITSNDTDEASCVVELSGKGLVPCTAPVITSASVNFDAVTPTSAHASVNYATADGYIAVVSTSNALTATPVNGSNYIVGSLIGGGKVVFNGNAADFNMSGLLENTPYFVFLFPYNNTDCTSGPLYYTESSIEGSFSTPVAPCVGGAESFTNVGTISSTYATRTWTGDNSVAWTATDARTDQNLTNVAITLRTGSVKNTTPVSGGIGTLSFNYKRIFTGNSTLKVLVNGVQQGSDITVSSDVTTVYSQVVDLTGAVTVEIQNSGNRTIIDDITWSCFETPNRPEIQLFDSNMAAKACGDFTIDFGNVAVNTNGEATFTIKNNGLQALNVTALTLSDAVNYTIVSPVAPVTVNSLATQDVVVKFNSAVAGSHPATLTVESNDADEASCVINLSATAQNACAAPSVTAADITVSNLTSSSADFLVEGITADGYIVVISTTGTTTAPVNGTVYTVGTTLGSGTVAYVGTNPSFTLSGLNAATTYTVKVYAYNTANCIGGPSYAAALETSAATTAAPCIGGGETFSNTGTNSSTYSTRTWTGDNGITWTATDSRNDQTLTGKAIALRTGSVKNTAVISGGVGTLTFNYKRVFTGNSTLKVFVNGTQYGADIVVSSDVTAVYSQVVNIAANATIEIVNSGNRTIVDDLSWTCYTAGSGARTALSTEENKSMETSEITLYPNPNNGQFQLDLPTESANVAIYNTLGKLVLNKEVSDNEVINLEGAGKGIYMMVITSGNKVSSKKVIVN